MQVKDIMTKDVIKVSKDMDIHAVARLFIDKDISGAPVVDGDSKFLGVVLEESLIFQDKKVHLPTFVSIAMGFLTFGEHKFEEEMKKIAASKVADIMETDIKTVSSDTSVEDVATMIVEEGKHYFPVVDEDVLVGVVTKKDIVRAIAQGKL